MRSFSTGVRQPSVTSQLSSRGANGQAFHQLAGNYTTAFTDAQVKVAGPPLTLVRSYNSKDFRTTGMFGAGWSTRWDMRVQEEPGTVPATLLVTYPDGREVRFADNGDGTFQSPPGMYATVGVVTGGGWRLMDKSSTVYLFDVQGRLIKITDGRGREQTLNYGVNGKLTSVTGVGGRSLSFAWTGDNVTSVTTDPVDGTALTWTYEYNSGKLTKVCSPAAALNCTTYVYGAGSSYQSAVLNSEPTGYWRLGDATHSSTAANLGRFGGSGVYGSNVTLGRPGALSGVTDTAVEFNNSTIEFSPNRLTKIANQGSTEIWFKTTQSGILVVNEPDDSDLSNQVGRGAILYVGLDGKLRGDYNESTTPITSSAPVNDGQWHHAVLTATGSTQILYLDGHQVGTKNGSAEGNYTHAMLGHGYVRSNHSPSVPGGLDAVVAFFPYYGFMDEFAVYDKALTPAEVQTHYAARLNTPNLMTKITLPSGRVWMENTYDSETGRVATHTDEHGGLWKIGPAYGGTVVVTDPHNGTMTYEHDPWRGYRLISEKDQLGKATRYEYDTGGFVSKVTDRNGIVTLNTHDKRGNLLTTLDCDPQIAGSCSATPERYTYYLNATDEFDPRNDQRTAYRDGRSTSETDNTYATTWEYNQYGEQTKETTPATLDFPTGRSAAATYTDGTEPAVGGGTTPAGLIKTETDARGTTASYKYTAAGDLAEETDAGGLVLRYEYDALGRTTARVEVSQAHPTGVRTTFTYSPLGQLLTHTGAGVLNEVTRTTHTAETRYTYNPDGKTLTTSVVDLTGGNPERKVTYTYDTHGRVATVTGAEGGVVSHTWDNTGARTTTTDELGNVIAYGYTARGELATRTLKNWTGSPVAPQPPADLVLESYAYDFEGRLASSTDAMGRTVARTYLPDDAVATTKAVGARLNGSTSGRDVVLESNTYDAAGNLTQQVTGGGHETTTFVYDAADRLTSRTFDPTGLGRTVTYTYDANDNVTRETLSATGTSRTESVEFAYNADDLVTRQTIENGTQDIERTWTRDDRGLVTSSTSPRGNLPGATGFKTEYNYDNAGRLIEIVAPQVQVERAGTASAVRPTSRFGYDNAGRRTHVIDPEGRASTTHYDRLGRVTSTQGTTYFAPLGNAPAPLAGAAGHWKMDEGTGTTLADAIGGRTATLSGTTAWVPGRTGSGVQFGANTHAVTAAPVLTTNASYTVSAWVRLTRGDLNATVASQNGTTKNAFKLAYAPSDGKWRFVTYDTDSTTAAEKRAVSNRNAKLNEWTHLAGVFDAASNRIRLYENGELVAANTVAATFNATGGFLIGRSQHNGAYEQSFRGDIDEVQTYGRALNNNEVRALAGAAPTTAYTYDAAGQVTQFTDTRGSTWATEYDALGNRVRVTEPGPNNQPGGQWVYEYNVLGELLGAVDPTGASTGSTYDDLGRAITATVVERRPTLNTLTTTLEYDDAGNKTREIGPGGRTTLFDVNRAGEVTAETDPMNDVTRFAYDLAGRAVKITNPLGNATVTDYDLAGREIATKDLDAVGTVLRETSTGYDVDGNSINETSAEGHVVQRTFDASGEITQLVEPVTAAQSITTTFGYDAVGNLTRTTDGRNNTVWTTYNSLGLVESTLEASTTAHATSSDRTWTISYDPGGNALTTLAPGGVRVDRVYDHLGRAVRETGAGAEVATPQRDYTYDLAGRETGIGDYTLEYNDRGLLTKVTKGATQVASFTHDAYGNPTQRVDPAGTAGFTWDNDDRLASAADPVTGRAFTYGYDAADRLATLTSANPGNGQTFEYDPMDRLLVHTLKDGGGAQLAKITYGWDKDDRLTSKVTEGTAGAGNNTYAYDQAGRLTSWTAPGGNVTTYEWDAAGNRTRAGADTFTYDERNRLTSGGGTDYTYTPRGTLASESTGGTTRNLAFDAYDRLITDGDVTYGYDAMGRLASRTKAGAEERYVYSGIDNDITAVTDAAGAVQAKYGRDPSGQLLSMQEGTGPALGVLSDQHGDVVATYSGTALVDSTAYDPFGEVTARVGSQRRLGYQGEYTDPDTGKVNMLARWYQPGTGGFISRDDVALSPYPSINLNRYTYGMGNPLSMTDPSGNCPFCLPLLFHAARIAAQLIARQIAQRAAAEAARRAAAYAAQMAQRRMAQEAAKRMAMEAAKRRAAQEAAKRTTAQAGKKAVAQTGQRKAVQETAKKTAQQGSKGKNNPKAHAAKSPKKGNAGPKASSKNAKSSPKANKSSPKSNKGGPKTNKGAKSNKGGSKSAKGKSGKSNKGSSKGNSKGSGNKGSKSGKSGKGKSGKSSGSGKSGKGSSKNNTKNELSHDIVDTITEDFGVGPTTGDADACFSWKGCAKDLIEDVVEDTTEDLIDEIIDEVTPQIPAESPGSDTCNIGNSFAPGTLVLMADGSRKPIEDIKVGDQVLASDPETGRTGSRPVVILITGGGDKTLIDITVTGEGIRGPPGGGDVLTATGNHPFWVPELREWLPASQLKPGMLLQTSAGTYAQVATVETRTARQRVHNLTVDDLHTYHVVAGDRAVLVHNTGGNGHKCDVTVTDSEGSFKAKFELESGDMTSEEKSLGYPNNAAFTHTEHRFSRMAGASTGPKVSLPNDPFAGLHQLKPGDNVTMQGQLPPCTRCKGAMNRMVGELGVSVVYSWIGPKGAGSWVAGK
ncbi:LamG-like jellyroll fold domain-containing protein [Sinosporangium album]|uniref:LamG-like jellyroll fold domain-containing protein n=1 Tax=Sinosporangium album TaxID=504805 RepID=UPI0015A4844F|nr:LamG-like jellyroll fold domain-containing protein [Sinosporangium album]